MTAELQELRQHTRWLEDQVSQATAVDDRLDEIDGRLDAINDTLERHADAFGQVVDGINRVADALSRQADALKVFVDAVMAAAKPQPTMADIFSAVSKPVEPRRPAAKAKPRKPKLSVVSKDGDEGPGAAP